MVIQPRHMHVAVHNANFEITVHTGAVLYCAITAKKRFFWNYSAGGGGRMTTLESAHMHQVACGPTWNMDNLDSFKREG